MEHAKLMQVLNDPIAHELLQSNIPARLAYIAVDGFPRAIPIGFHWNGAQFIMATVSLAPNVQVLRANPKVAFTIDTATGPPHVLLVRGTASITIVDGVVPEYLLAAKKQIDPHRWEEFEAQVQALSTRMARIAIEPEWAKVLEFEMSPTPIEQLIRKGPKKVE